MNARERHVAGQPPNWSRPSQAFRHFDGTLANDWRHAHPGLPTARCRRVRFRSRIRDEARWPWVRRWLRLAGAWALDQIHPDPRERRKIYIYLTVSMWVVMLTIGFLASHTKVHP